MIATVDLEGAIEIMPDTVEEEIMQNVRMIVGTWRSEVPLDRQFGIDTNLLDAPVNVIKALLIADLTATIARCEPRAKLKSLDFKGDAQEGTIEPVLTIEM